MPHSQILSLEVTHALCERARSAFFGFGEDTALVAVQHMLEQTIDLFETIADLGLRRENMFALGKVYSNSRSVIETLRNGGVTIVDSTTPEPGRFDEYFERDARKLWQVAGEKLAGRRIKRVLVLDDGGNCITTAPPALLRRYAMCGVEQTSFGMFLFEKKPPSFAVLSWARAAVKLEIGGHIFSQSLIERLRNEFLDRGPEQLGVIGMGSIGRAAAKLAAREGRRVLYYDPREDLEIDQILLMHSSPVESLEELMVRCDFVIGCSGRNPFQNNWPLKHRPGIKLVSASGSDQEFGPIINYLKTKPDFHVDPDSWDISSEIGPCGPIQIAYLGYPYNFVSRASEAVPTRIVQFETGGLLAALIQARLYLEFCENGRARNKGIHRVSPAAQKFVYEEWLKVMRDSKIDLVGVFGHDPAKLHAAQHETWLATKSEPPPSTRYVPLRRLEDEMDQIVCRECDLKISRQAAG
jgi:D-isomer specific 2-hydroxyacid dehydrogenase, NAD binding domain